MPPDRSQTVADLGEAGVIELFSAEAGALGKKIVVGNGDDAAAWFVEPHQVSVVTTDTMVEGVHFDLGWESFRSLGRKLMSINLSDIAAMGARPRYALVSVVLRPDLDAGIIGSIAAGVREQAKLFGVAIVGGNTSQTTGPLVMTVTLIGRAGPDELVRRRGTQLGDSIYVTGRLGEARAGLAIIQSDGPESHSPLLSPFLDPKPRTDAGRKLGKLKLAHAMCDISDGFSADLRSLIVPERLGARIFSSMLPISSELRSFAADQGTNAEEWAISGGEDYELLFTAAPEDEAQIISTCAAVGTPVCRVGEVTEGPTLEAIMPNGVVSALPSGFVHFED